MAQRASRNGTQRSRVIGFRARDEEHAEIEEDAIAAGMTAIGYTGGGHSWAEHGDTLTAAGAHAICASWDAVRAKLQTRGFA